jgi:hypothetical protein
MTTFPMTIVQLRDIYDENPDCLPWIFWKTIDNLPDDQLFNWVERLLEIKNCIQGNDYIRVIDIQHQYRKYKLWTIKQKRSIAMDLIKNWYDVEFRFELY